MRVVIALGCLLVTASACGPQPPLLISNIEISAPLPGRQMSAGYLQLTNNTGEVITISRVSSPEFAKVEVHESLLQDGIARMRRIEQLTVPAHATVTLERGGMHLMLMQPSGQAEAVTLNFHAADVLLLSVRSATSRSIQ